MSPQLLSLIGGGLAGFLFQLIAQGQADRAKILELAIKKQESEDNSADKASKRDINGGKFIRRFIVIIVLTSLLVFPMILTLIDLPTIVQTVSPSRSFFGIFYWGGWSRFYEIRGYLISDELKTATLAIVGYYFGNASAKRS